MHLICNQKVEGSNPSSGSIVTPRFDPERWLHNKAREAILELRLFRNQKIVGSNPTMGSIYFKRL